MATEAEIESAAEALYDVNNYMRLSQPDDQDRIIVPGMVTWSDVVRGAPGLAKRLRWQAKLVLEAAERVRNSEQGPEDGK